ncbi:hypothetical protein NADFUDRAFT_40833 [Nadsonia fulvescens var. elongata DSM 6958]|uniref:DCG1-like protein n=1 Tax=Nadsonia fulvescens var. elongata DSM 6958 TaxID=857566 RepID=A0A1E3PLW9_9ASCO|nr:hypothetical protein NADFUDRAFT_40833 [Nadsonia fulvescens var. elongata DSM 6958]
MAQINRSSVLIINPNSTKNITDTLQELITPPPDFSYHFFTGPSGAPAQIDNVTSEIASAAACLPALVPLLPFHDAFLVACYSDHPLVHALREHTDKPVMGIFQASVLHSLGLGRGKFGIVTTATIWETLLDEAVHAFIGSEISFAGTFSTGLGVLELHDAPKELVRKKISEAAQKAVGNGANIICLGCAGMSGMEDIVKEAVGNKIRVIDGVQAGAEILVGIVRSKYDA